MGYRKIVVNGKTVVDFSDKVSQDDVIKGKYFYNQKGDIEEGGVDPSGQALGTAKKFVITPGTTEFRVPHGWNYGEDLYGKQQFDFLFKNVEELYIPESLNTIYPDSFVCGYGEGMGDFWTAANGLKKIHFEDFSSFINSKYIFWTNETDESGNYHNYEFSSYFYEGKYLYADYPCFGYNPWNLATKKPYAMLDKDGQPITYFKMPVINDGHLPAYFFTNLYIDTLELAHGYTQIDSYAFRGCAIKRLILPDSVGASDFLSNTSGIKEVIYSGTATDNFGEGVYPIQSAEESIYNEPTEQGFITLKEDSTNLQGYYGTDCNIVIPKNIAQIKSYCFNYYEWLETVIIPDSVTSIGNNAFSCCTSLKSITIPDSVTTMGYSAFGGCTSLTSIVIPNSLTTISESVFANCTSLTSVTIPDSVTSIGRRAFADCTSLTSVTIGNSVTNIENYAFNKYSGKSIDIYCTSETPPAIQSNTFYSNSINKIYVPTAKAVNAYKAATNWSALSSKIVQGVKE